MNSIKLLLGVLLLVGSGTLLAQQSITGTVRDDGGTPLIGASILVEGTTVGTVTDIDGEFSLNLPAEAQALVVSYTGFTTALMAYR